MLGIIKQLIKFQLYQKFVPGHPLASPRHAQKSPRIATIKWSSTVNRGANRQ